MNWLYDVLLLIEFWVKVADLLYFVTALFVKLLDTNPLSDVYGSTQEL